MTITQRVENILRASQDARNSDKELWLIYAQKSGVGLSSQQLEAIRDMPSFETLRRVRQKIQQVGSYPATESITKERAHKAMVMEQTSPRFSPQQLEKTLNIKILPWGV